MRGIYTIKYWEDQYQNEGNNMILISAVISECIAVFSFYAMTRKQNIFSNALNNFVNNPLTVRE